MPSQPSAIPAETSGNSSPYLRDSALFDWAHLSLRTDSVFVLAIAIAALNAWVLLVEILR